jgi:hypothetical protein
MEKVQLSKSDVLVLRFKGTPPDEVVKTAYDQIKAALPDNKVLMITDQVELTILEQS